MLIGAHIAPDDPLATAAAVGADCVKIFLGDPQSWKKPPARGDADQLAAADLPIYVHAPYLVNVASAGSRIRIPSRKILQQSCDAAAAIGAVAVIVHGGTVTGDEVVSEGFGRWRKALQQLDTEVPVLIAITDAIDLVHCNDSRDEQGSSRDRHESLTKGQIPPEDILAAVRLAGAPVICETPDVARDIAWLREHL